MEKNIHIFDNFFLETDLQKIIYFFDNQKWNCQCFKRQFRDEGDGPFWRIELEHENLFNDYLKNIIEHKLFQQETQLKRIYSVGQMYEQNSTYHIDDSEENTYTFCFYINQIHIDNDNGYFIVKIPKEKYRICIEPIMNRGVLFPCNYIHKGTGFGVFCDKLRICIAWKFKLSSTYIKI